MIHQNQNKQIMAIPVNNQSKPVKFFMDQLHLCKQVKSLFLCDLSKLNIQPSQESCLIALANNQYLDTIHLCQFTISRPQELLYQIQSNHYLLYLADHQYPVYNCTGNNWSRFSIPAGISFHTLDNECDLNLKEHQINYQAYYQPPPVIKLFAISSVSNQLRKSSIKTQTIIQLVAFCILSFLAIIVTIQYVLMCVNRPCLIQLSL